MSISSMARLAMERKVASEAVQPGPESISASEKESQDQEKGSQDNFTQALEAIMAYIPTEILTLYVATIAALQGGSAAAAGGSTAATTLSQPPWLAFFVFLAATPVFVWMIYAAKFKARLSRLPWKPSDMPTWEMISAMIAYVAWAYALPNTPFREFGWYSSALAAVGVMATAAILGLVTPLVHPKKKAA